MEALRGVTAWGKKPEQKKSPLLTRKGDRRPLF
jgi:hypothetical protein